MKKSFISTIFLLLYSVIGFVPNLVAIDKNVTQFTFLAVINFLYLGYKSVKKESIFFVNRVLMTFCIFHQYFSEGTCTDEGAGGIAAALAFTLISNIFGNHT